MCRWRCSAEVIFLGIEFAWTAWTTFLLSLEVSCLFVLKTLLLVLSDCALNCPGSQRILDKLNPIDKRQIFFYRILQLRVEILCFLGVVGLLMIFIIAVIIVEHGQKIVNVFLLFRRFRLRFCSMLANFQLMVCQQRYTHPARPRLLVIMAERVCLQN